MPGPARHVKLERLKLIGDTIFVFVQLIIMLYVQYRTRVINKVNVSMIYFNLSNTITIISILNNYINKDINQNNITLSATQSKTIERISTLYKSGTSHQKV